MNAACNAALQAMLTNDPRAAADAEPRLQALRLRALEGGDLQADQLLRVVEALLHHAVLKEAEELQGPYAAAFNRIVNQVAGSEWKLVLERPSPDVAGGQEEPRFSTWEEVRDKQRARSSGGGGSSSGGSGSPGSPVNASYYQLLGVAPAASQPDIKAAYRQLALKLHPDINSAADAGQRFAEVAAAYDILSDPDSRQLYDRYGPEGMKGRAGKCRLPSRPWSTACVCLQCWAQRSSPDCPDGAT
jgi:DnaJ-domain-containing protein 1